MMIKYGVAIGPSSLKSHYTIPIVTVKIVPFYLHVWSEIW